MNDIRYLELDHTADVGFRIHAGSLTELFETAAQSMFNYILPVEEGSVSSGNLDIFIQADSQEELLRDWLAELLYMHATRHLLFNEFSCSLISDTILRATVAGIPFTEKMTSLATELKAVTWHGLYLKKDDSGYEAQVIFDT